jgi:hypothetical protein
MRFTSWKISGATPIRTSGGVRHDTVPVFVAGCGAKAEAARELGVKRHAVTDRFAERQEPTGEQVLLLSNFSGSNAASEKPSICP